MERAGRRLRFAGSSIGHTILATTTRKDLRSLFWLSRFQARTVHSRLSKGTNDRFIFHACGLHPTSRSPRCALAASSHNPAGTGLQSLITYRRALFGAFSFHSRHITNVLLLFAWRRWSPTPLNATPTGSGVEDKLALVTSTGSGGRRARVLETCCCRTSLLVSMYAEGDKMGIATCA
jgi:hypothetical protein